MRSEGCTWEKKEVRGISVEGVSDEGREEGSVGTKAILTGCSHLACMMGGRGRYRERDCLEGKRAVEVVAEEKVNL